MKQQQTQEDLRDWSDEKLPSLATSVVTAALRWMSPLRLSAAAFPQEAGLGYPKYLTSGSPPLRTAAS